MLYYYKYGFKQHYCSRSQIIFTDNRSTESQSKPIETHRVCQEGTIRIVNLLCGKSTNWTGDALLQFAGELMPMYSDIGQCSLSEVTFAGLHLLYKH